MAEEKEEIERILRRLSGVGADGDLLTAGVETSQILTLSVPVLIWRRCRKP